MWKVALTICLAVAGPDSRSALDLLGDPQAVVSENHACKAWALDLPAFAALADTTEGAETVQGCASYAAARQDHFAALSAMGPWAFTLTCRPEGLTWCETVEAVMGLNGRYAAGEIPPPPEYLERCPADAG